MAMVGMLLVLLGVTSMVIIGGMKQLGSTDTNNGSLSEESHNQISLTLQRGNRYQAETLSATGIRLAIQWLVQQSAAPTNTTAFAPSSVSNFFGATTDTGWTKLTFSQSPTVNQLSGPVQINGDVYVKFYPYASNNTGARKMYAIESRGEYMGYSFLSRIFVRQNSFSRYAYFSDTCPTSWWVAGLTRFQGPVHVNGVDTTGTAVDPAAALSMIWTKDLGSTGGRLFTYSESDYFTTAMASSQLKWYRKRTTGTTLETPSTNNWTYVTAAAVSPQTAIPLIPMPAANTNQRTAALGTATAITTVGVQVPGVGTPSAGIYINGDIRDINLSTSGTGNTTQIVTLIQYNATTQKDVRTTITMNPVTNTTVVKVENRTNTTNTWNIASTGTWTTASTTNYTGGVTNGVIYVNGNIGEQTGTRRGGLSGSVANAVTDAGGVVTRPWGMLIATEQTKSVNINGGIVYQNLISDSTNANNLLSTSAAALTNSGMLGLVAGNMQLVDSDDGGTALTNISVHAVCMAYSTFNATNPTTRTAGAFNLIGGYIVKTNGTFGTALPDGTVQNGFLMNRNFDQRVTDSPPPSFPAVEKNYQIMSYQRAVTSLG